MYTMAYIDINGTHRYTHTHIYINVCVHTYVYVTIEFSSLPGISNVTVNWLNWRIIEVIFLLQRWVAVLFDDREAKNTVKKGKIVF